MSDIREMFYGLSKEEVYLSVKFGDFSDVLNDKDSRLLSNLIWSSRELSKSNDVKIYGCFVLPLIGKKSILKKMSLAGIPFFFAPTDRKRKMPIVHCEEKEEVRELISTIWGHCRLVFFAARDESIFLDLKQNWVESLEKIPSEILERVDFVAAQFFHGLWVEITLKTDFEPAEIFKKLIGVDGDEGINFTFRDDW